MFATKNVAKRCQNRGTEILQRIICKEGSATLFNTITLLHSNLVWYRLWDARLTDLFVTRHPGFWSGRQRSAANILQKAPLEDKCVIYKGTSWQHLYISSVVLESTIAAHVLQSGAIVGLQKSDPAYKWCMSEVKPSFHWWRGWYARLIAILQFAIFVWHHMMYSNIHRSPLMRTHMYTHTHTHTLQILKAWISLHIKLLHDYVDKNFHDKSSRMCSKIHKNYCCENFVIDEQYNIQTFMWKRKWMFKSFIIMSSFEV